MMTGSAARWMQTAADQYAGLEMFESATEAELWIAKHVE